MNPSDYGHNGRGGRGGRRGRRGSGSGTGRGNHQPQVTGTPVVSKLLYLLHVYSPAFRH
jgi:hypothetical protein